MRARRIKWDSVASPAGARPIFLRGRIFALLGYELVEGREDDGRIRELRRVSFAPPSAGQAAR